MSAFLTGVATGFFILPAAMFAALLWAAERRVCKRESYDRRPDGVYVFGPCARDRKHRGDCTPLAGGR